MGHIRLIGHMLEAKNILINYDDRNAVRDVSLRAEPGNVIAILGPNGAGKSTLLRALNGSIAPASGEVLLDGKPLRTFARRVVARQIGVVAQEADLRFPVTVFEFVVGGRYAWSSAKAWGWENDRDIEVAQNSIRETELA
ncbi:MAG TPA: ABC transporter ATP-binding protein, partial [Pyrinomonadaceae bacterium]